MFHSKVFLIIAYYASQFGLFSGHWQAELIHTSPEPQSLLTVAGVQDSTSQKKPPPIPGTAGKPDEKILHTCPVGQSEFPPH